MANKMPYHQNAEKALLGAVLLQPSIIINLMDLIYTNQFYDQANAIIFQAMKELKSLNQDIDIASIASFLESKEQLTQIGGINYLVDISTFVPSIEHYETYVDLIRQAALKRDIINTASSIAEEGLTTDITSFDYLDKAEKLIFELSKQRKIGAFTEIDLILEEVKQKAEANKNNPGHATGLSTGYEGLDRALGGLKEEELVILAARPAMGKSAFAMNLAVNVAKRNKNSQAGVAIFSLEMSNDQLGARMLSNEAGIDNSKIRSGNLSASEWSMFELGRHALNSLNIYFDDSASSTLNEIRAKCRKLAAEGKLNFVLIDYLQLIHEKASSRQEAVAAISRSLKQMARELKIPVLALSQLSRDLEKRENKRPLLSDLRESGSIEQDADVVIFIHRDDYFESKDERGQAVPAEIIIAKNRHGQTGKLNFIFAPNFSRFSPQSNLVESE